MILLGISLLLPKLVFAEFSLSVRPYEGGYDLSFGKIGLIGPGINREVTVRINSDIGKQYRLIQTLFEPLTNAQGISISSRDNFVVYGLRGTNQNGTLSVEHEEPVSFGRTIIYTSNHEGNSDSFTLVYALKGPFDVPAGVYRGRIGFTLEAIDATQGPVTVFLNIFAEIEVESSIEIKTPTGSKLINLSSKSNETKTADVIFNMQGVLGSQFRILQSVAGPLRSADGEELPYEAVNFSLKDAKKGLGPAQPIPLLPSEQILYTSGGRGEGENFIVNYTLGNLDKLKAGRYKTNLRYSLQGGTAGSQIQNLDSFILEVEIEKLFDIFLSTESGEAAISFRDVKPNNLPRTFGLDVEVKSNLGKQYQVTQKVLSDLTNKEGKAIPSKNFTVRTEKINATKGILKLPEKTEVKKGDTTLFISDADGSSDSFKLVYELVATSDIIAGDYSASVVYSLSEL